MWYNKIVMAATIISFVLIGLGLFGVFLPLLPGVPLAWLGMLIYAYFTDFQAISLTAVLVFLGLTLLTILVDFIAPILGAKKYKASKEGIVGASLGLFFGIFIFGPVGVMLGPLVGAFIGEIISGKRHQDAIRPALGTFIGFLLSAVIKLAVILAILGVLIAAVF